MAILFYLRPGQSNTLQRLFRWCPKLVWRKSTANRMERLKQMNIVFVSFNRCNLICTENNQLLKKMSFPNKLYAKIYI